ncbi:hypothetical protein LMG23994_00788 [Cupriavidus pinatubonensis]|uniref:GATA-type domain-containing protein n=1 Tax=Cupriavidus pinatubonensis TaxID=248026 RepID=A0ABM8WEG4_9BURK|nr:hypothetical protein LMG23994_00788 [Cupriavidus pinatubonensis]
MNYGVWAFQGACILITAYLAHRRGKNPLLWGALAYVLTVATPFVLLFVTRQKRVTLKQYLERFPHCRMNRGIACAYCNSSSIRLWRYGGLLSNRDQHLCNHCGSYLYDS